MNEQNEIAWKHALEYAYNKGDKNSWDASQKYPDYAIEYNGKLYPNKIIYKYSIEFLRDNYPDIFDIESEINAGEGKELNKYLSSKGAIAIDLKSDKKYWIYQPGEDARFWEMNLEEGTIRLGWDDLGDLAKYESKNEIVRSLQSISNTNSSKKNDATANWDFYKTMEVGDIIIVKKGKRKLLGYGEVISDYRYDADRIEYRSIRDVKWIKSGEWVLDFDLVLKTLTNITQYESEISKGQKYYEYLLSIINETNTMKKSNLVDLLKYKKQIILQGPPGTGKTRLAKKVAYEILNVNPKGLTPVEMIEDFFKEGKSNNRFNVDFNNRLSEFYQLFPKDGFLEIDLDDFCIGKGNNTNFCWWIERGLEKYGKFSPGQSGNYVIYYSKDIGDYIQKYKGSIEENFERIQIALEALVVKEDPTLALGLFGESFIIKILNSYSPEKYFPINGRNSLVNALKIFNVESKKVSTLDLNLKLQKIFDDYKLKYPSSITSLDFMSFLFGHFDLKQKGDIYETSDISSVFRKPSIVQFHPSYTYEDFVRGIVAETTDKGIVYKSENKILGELAEEAKQNPYSDFVLIIDEINRANLSSVLGELIYALEYRYYFEDTEENQSAAIVESAYELKNREINKKSRELCLPENLYIIGTMNTADRSVGHIDYAIRRRFAFVEVLPEDLSSVIAEEFYVDMFNDVATLFKTHLNHTDFELNDVQVGHSYFIDKSRDGATKSMRWTYEVKPILLEYIKDGILKESAKQEIEDLNRNYA